MKIVFLRKFLITGFIIFAFMGYVKQSVIAAGLTPLQEQTSSDITLDQPQTIEMGNSFVLSGKIVNPDGKPLAEKQIFFSINGEYLSARLRLINLENSQENLNNLWMLVFTKFLRI